MKTKFYLLTVFTFLTLVVSAQFPRFNTMLSEEWSNNTWVNALEIHNFYNDKGRLDSTLHRAWDADVSKWNNAIKISYTLNTDGTVKETVSKIWEENEWQDFQKTTYTYSPTKKVLTETTQMGSDGIFMDLSKITYTYNDKDSLATQLTQVPDLLTGQMTNSILDTYTYNADGTENQMVSQNWNKGTSAWENSYRYTNTYDNAKKIISDLTETWAVNAWVNEFKSTYTYNGTQVQESLEQEWETDKWVDVNKTTYSYTAANEMHQLVSQKWDTASSLWVNEGRITFTYGTTGINPLADQSLKVYPNPFKDQVTLQSGLVAGQDVKIVNSLGQVVKSFKSQGKAQEIDLGYLENGMYFIRINQPGHNQSIKMLKVK